MAVRPWENRLLDINLRDGVMTYENGSAEGKNSTRTQFKPAGKRPHASNLTSQKNGPSHSNDSGSSLSQSAGMLEASTTLYFKPKTKSFLDDTTEEGNWKPGFSSRSHSNPKERSMQTDKHAKKRLSLPNSGESVLSSYPIHCNYFLLLYLFFDVGLIRGSSCRTYNTTS